MATILVVDDAAFLRMRCGRMLTEKGYEVVEAQDGRDAVAKYRENRPDAVLMDITMPELDGLAALREIRDLDPTARVTMLTSLGQQQVVMEALRAGARDYVLKPFDAARVLAAVQKMPA